MTIAAEKFLAMVESIVDPFVEVPRSKTSLVCPTQLKKDVVVRLYGDTRSLEKDMVDINVLFSIEGLDTQDDHFCVLQEPFFLGELSDDAYIKLMDAMEADPEQASRNLSRTVCAFLSEDPHLMIDMDHDKVWITYSSSNYESKTLVPAVNLKDFISSGNCDCFDKKESSQENTSEI